MELTSALGFAITSTVNNDSPLNYARHSLRSLTIWLFTLPFVLVREFGLLTAPVMGIIAWLLFGVYQIGCSIEDPFQGSLRLSQLCDAIYRDVMYDVDLRNKRDSAFHVEPELKEWDRLGPIQDSKLLLVPMPTYTTSSNSAPNHQPKQSESNSISSGLLRDEHNEAELPPRDDGVMVP